MVFWSWCIFRQLCRLVMLGLPSDIEWWTIHAHFHTHGRPSLPLNRDATWLSLRSVVSAVVLSWVDGVTQGSPTLGSFSRSYKLTGETPRKHFAGGEKSCMWARSQVEGAHRATALSRVISRENTLLPALDFVMQEKVTIVRAPFKTRNCRIGVWSSLGDTALCVVL